MATIEALIQKGIRSKFPSPVQPMQCSLANEPVNDPAYVHEIKWDGYRMMAYKKSGTIRLLSKSGKNYVAKFPVIVKALSSIRSDFVMDGEIVVIDDCGRPDILLWLSGYRLTELPLLKRKSILKELLEARRSLKFSFHFTDAEKLFALMKDKGMEGIVSKKAKSLYRPGEKGEDWLKTRTQSSHDFVIGGWVEGKVERFLGSLLVGVYKNGKLEYAGRSVHGIKEKEMSIILKRLKAIETTSGSFVNEVIAAGQIHWVQPLLVANFKLNVEHGRFSFDQAVFNGFRHDKAPGQVVTEKTNPPGGG